MEKREIKSVTVYCASSSKIAPRYYDEAYKLGRALAQNGMRCLCGAGSQGLMAALTDSTLQHGGSVLGVIPQFMCDEGWCHPSLTECKVVETMHQRKEILMSESDAIVALPGGCGTLEELLEAITWKQLGLCNKPIVIVNVDGYYNTLIELLSHAVSEHFMREQHTRMWCVVNGADEVVEALYQAPEWSGEVRKIAAI